MSFVNSHKYYANVCKYHRRNIVDSVTSGHRFIEEYAWNTPTYAVLVVAIRRFIRRMQAVLCQTHPMPECTNNPQHISYTTHFRTFRTCHLHVDARSIGVADMTPKMCLCTKCTKRRTLPLKRPSDNRLDIFDSENIGGLHYNCNFAKCRKMSQMSPARNIRQSQKPERP